MDAFRGHQTARMRLTRSGRRYFAWHVHRARTFPTYPGVRWYRMIILFPLPIWGTGGRDVGMPCGRARCRCQSNTLGCLPTELSPWKS